MLGALTHDEVSFAIDLETLAVAPMPEITLQSVGIRERADLQRWISDHPEIVGRDLLLVTSEFDQWEIRDRKVDDRLDVLFPVAKEPRGARGKAHVVEKRRFRALSKPFDGTL